LYSSLLALGIAAAGAIGLSSQASAESTLRLLTWSGYVPQAIIDKFKQETGITVEVTLSNNEEMISKLRATGGAGFDLAQPSADRVLGPQTEFGIYKPLELSKIETDKFIPSKYKAATSASTVDGKVYAVPHFWGTDGFIVNTKTAVKLDDYLDVCGAGLDGKLSYRAKRPVLLGIAFGMKMDPFAAYGDTKKYQDIMEKAGDKMIECKKNVKFYWDGKDQLVEGIRSGALVGGLGWDSIAATLHVDNPDIAFVPPKSGALGWIDAYAIPAKGRNDDAAYKWINFNLRPEIAAMAGTEAQTLPAIKGAAEKMGDVAIAKLFKASFSEADLNNIKWYPAVPAGLEAIDGKILDRVRAAN
jgi:spermidine/putrescine transport system substrate-binding protein